MSEKVRLSEEQRNENKENIEKIKVLTEQIKEIVPKLHGVACHLAYENSVINLEKKNEKFMGASESFRITAEEKELLKQIRNGKMQISKISPDMEGSGSDEQEPSSSGDKKQRVRKH